MKGLFIVFVLTKVTTAKPFSLPLMQYSLQRPGFPILDPLLEAEPIIKNSYNDHYVTISDPQEIIIPEPIIPMPELLYFVPGPVLPEYKFNYEGILFPDPMLTKPQIRPRSIISSNPAWFDHKVQPNSMVNLELVMPDSEVFTVILPYPAASASKKKIEHDISREQVQWDSMESQTDQELENEVEIASDHEHERVFEPDVLFDRDDAIESVPEENNETEADITGFSDQDLEDEAESPILV